jgi:hypothetical protein
LLEVEKISHDCILAEEAFQQINRPRQVETQRASALRFANLKVQSLWNALLLFSLLSTGFSNQELREHLALLMGQCPEQITPGWMTYQLRRLRHDRIIQHIPHSHRYRSPHPACVLRCSLLGRTTRWIQFRFKVTTASCEVTIDKRRLIACPLVDNIV